MIEQTLIKPAGAMTTLEKPTNDKENNVSLKTMGAAIKQLRKQRGWTQADLANAMGMYQTRISDYELGNTQPGMDTLALLEQKLEVPGVLWAAYIQGEPTDRTSIDAVLDGLSLSSEEELKVLDYIDLIIRARMATEMKKPTPLEQKIADARRVQQSREVQIKKDKAEKKERESSVKTSQ